MGLDKEQRHVAKVLIKVGKRMHVPRRDIISALITGITESSLRNLKGGDGTSVGWRQETASSYPNVNRNDVKAGAKRFYKELRSAPKGSVGARAQAVQRSAYPDRYQEHVGEARHILKSLGGHVGKGGGGGKSGGVKAGAGASAKGGTKTIHTPSRPGQVDVATALSLIQNRLTDPNAFIQYAEAQQAARIPGSTKVIHTKGAKGGKNPPKVGKPGKIGLGGGKSKKIPREHGSGRAIQIGSKVAKKFNLTVTSTTGGGHVPGSYHYQNRAIDISGSPQNMRRAFLYLQKHMRHKHITELFYDPIGHYWDNGNKVSGSIGGHSDHVHFAV